MDRRTTAARLPLSIGMVLGTVALNLAPVSRDAAAESHRHGLPRLEFEMPAGEPAESSIPEAGQAGPQHAGLPPQPAVVPGTLRGVMGYRLPLVSRQQVPAQVVSGVLIPAHTAYVILQPGYWELVGLSSGEVEALRAASNADEPATQSEPVLRGWNPLRLFKKQRTPAGKE